MPRRESKAWNLESFLDSLVVELDKAQDTLAVKGVTRPLTYSVKELTLDLHIFPDFDGKAVRFMTAKPGETGASKISFQLGSITSEQIRRTTAPPISEDDVDIEDIEEIDEEVKASLRKHGVKSTRDLERLESKDLNMDKIAFEKPARKKTTYKDLANTINQARRRRSAPRVSQVSLAREAGSTVLSIQGSNLAVASGLEGFPAAAFDGESVPVLGASDTELRVKVRPELLKEFPHQIQIALDPYAVIKMNLKPPPRDQDNTNDSERS